MLCCGKLTLHIKLSLPIRMYGGGSVMLRISYVQNTLKSSFYLTIVSLSCCPITQNPQNMFKVCGCSIGIMWKSLLGMKAFVRHCIH